MKTTENIFEFYCRYVKESDNFRNGRESDRPFLLDKYVSYCFLSRRFGYRPELVAYNTDTPA